MKHPLCQEAAGYPYDRIVMDERMKKRSIWSDALKWIEDIPISSRLSLYPLQLANAIRILSNDAVFIFDEVGCGKTISSGIMAKTYLCQNPDRQSQDILVITTNTVKINRQFEKDWEKIDGGLKPVVYNNLVNSDLKRLSAGKKWGLVVIDEAHEFSNTDTNRYMKLLNALRAEKVVFLTATPLRGGGTFHFYQELANAILARQAAGKELDRLIISESVEPQELICAQFDPTKPVTRYFKDTVKYLDIHEKKEKAHRVIPELWYPEGDESREETLCRNIERKLANHHRSRFVIFVRLKKEAELLIRSMEKLIKSNLSIATVFADEKEKLKDYENDISDLPTVLILNYQVGEAGVNLPGYDHVIHWHISSDPVRLEQRYGRIDRMTSRHAKIYSCFVIPQHDDSNSKNLVSAIDYTMGELLTSLPARNVLLTEKALSLYQHKFNQSLNEYEEELKTYERMEDVINHLNAEELVKIFRTADKEENEIPDHKDLVEFIKQKGDTISWDEKEGGEVLRETVQYEIKRQIKRLKNRIHKKEDADNMVDAFQEKVSELEDRSDQIFYSTKPHDPSTLETIDSQDWGCAKYIQETEDYQLLQEIVKCKEAVRTVLRCADQDVLFASELFFKIGEIHSFTEELQEKGMTPAELAYKYKR